MTLPELHLVAGDGTGCEVKLGILLQQDREGKFSRGSLCQASGYVREQASASQFEGLTVCMLLIH